MQFMNFPKPSDLIYDVEPGVSCEASYLDLRVEIPNPEDRLDPDRVEEILKNYGIDLIAESKSTLYVKMLTEKFNISPDKAKSLVAGVDFKHM